MRKVPTNRGWWILLVAVCVLALFPAPVRADEFTLNDGRKITGTIVGYEKDMFRIQTDFGFILVRKDKVVSIRVQGAKQEAATETKATDTVPPDKTDMQTHSVSSPVAVKPAPPPPPPPPPPPVSRPLNEQLPAHLVEHVEGPEYINDTFQFSMFKPLGWRIFEGLHKEKVSAIVALSSEDEHTLLFVDRQVWSGAPNLADDRVEANLRSTYEDYRKISETRTTVDGREAIRRDFTGVIDGVEWHGVSVRMAKGNTVFGIVGLTSSETFAFQQAVFNKIIKSFRFFPPEPQTGAQLRRNP